MSVRVSSGSCHTASSKARRKNAVDGPTATLAEAFRAVEADPARARRAVGSGRNLLRGRDLKASREGSRVKPTGEARGARRR